MRAVRGVPVRQLSMPEGAVAHVSRAQWGGSGDRERLLRAPRPAGEKPLAAQRCLSWGHLTPRQPRATFCLTPREPRAHLHQRTEPRDRRRRVGPPVRWG